MKKCSKCSLEKDISEFQKAKVFKDGLFRWCKSCKKEYDQIYRKSDKVQNLYKSKDYIVKKSEYQEKRNIEDGRLLMYRNTKFRALKNNIPFNIDLNDLIIPEYCPLLGIKLLKREYGIKYEKRGFHMNSPSIDKIVPELGYVKGNVRVISMKANAMKYSATQEELITFCTNVLKQFKKKKNV